MNKEQKTARKELRREAGEAFIANLKRLRKEKELSQEDLSLKARLNRAHVGFIETGERLPELDTVHRLAGALEVPPGRLFDGFYWVPDDTPGGGHVTNEPPAAQ